MTKWLNVNDIRKFEIELSSHCNARCPLCIRQIRGTDQERPEFLKGHLSFKQIQTLVEQLPDPKKVVFYFGGIGGDPMMNPEIVDIFEYCSKNVKSVSMDTNASLRSANTWKALGQISAKYYSSVTFSIDGLQDTNHIYRIRTNWSKIIENAKSFINSGGYATWKYIVFKHNQHQIEKARQLSKELRFHDFRYENSVRHYENAGPLQPEPPDGVEKSKIKTNAYSIQVNEIKCKVLEKKMMYVSNDFKLYPCCFFHTAHNFSPEVIKEYMDSNNDLNTRSISDILNDKFYQEKLISDWKMFEPNICAKACNQVKYWERDIKIIYNEKTSSDQI